MLQCCEATIVKSMVTDTSRKVNRTKKSFKHKDKQLAFRVQEFEQRNTKIFVISHR